MNIEFDQISELIIVSGIPENEPSMAAIQYRFARSGRVGSPPFNLIDELTPKLDCMISLAFS